MLGQRAWNTQRGRTRVLIAPVLALAIVLASLIAIVAHEHAAAGAWSSAQIQPLPVPANANSTPEDQPNVVTCLSAASCVAMGTYLDANGFSIEVDTLSQPTPSAPAAWTSSHLLPPLLANSTASFIAPSSIACLSATSCVALGDYSATSPTNSLLGTFIASEIRGTWRQSIAMVPPTNTLQNPIVLAGSASCSSGLCYLLANLEGQDANQNEVVQPFIEAWNPQTGQVSAPIALSLHGYGSLQLSSLSCTSATDCIAVGQATSASSANAIPIAVADSISVGGDASALSVIDNANRSTEGASLSSVSCVGPSTCTAVGLYQLPPDSPSPTAYLPEVVTLGANGWSSGRELELPHGLGASAEQTLITPTPLSVTCSATPTTCTIIANYFDPSTSQSIGAVAQSSTGTWGALTDIPAPTSDGGYYLLYGASCPLATSCTAVGQYFTPGEEPGVFDPSSVALAWVPSGSAPDPVVGVSTHLNSGTASVSWHAPAATQVSHYQVWVQAGSSPAVLAARSSTTSARVNGLGPNVRYAISVVAVGPDGQASQATAAGFRTPALLPGSPALYRLVVGHREIVAHWRSPRTDGGSPVRRYEVRLSSAGTRTSTFYVSSSARALRIMGLASGRTYTVTVAALNGVGRGPRSGARSATPR